jgi:hypothetical protein
MGEISAMLCNYRDNVENCCTATSGLGIEKYGGLTDYYAALHKPILWDLTALERAWVNGYRQGQKEAR